MCSEKAENKPVVSRKAGMRRDGDLRSGDQAVRLLSSIPGLCPSDASGTPQYVTPECLYTLPGVPKDKSNTSFPPPIENPVL